MFLILVVMKDDEDGGDIIEAFISFGTMGVAIYVNNLLISPFFKTKKPYKYGSFDWKNEESFLLEILMRMEVYLTVFTILNLIFMEAKQLMED